MKSIALNFGDTIVYQIDGKECPLAKRATELAAVHKKYFSPHGIKGVILGKEIEITAVQAVGSE